MNCQDIQENLEFKVCLLSKLENQDLKLELLALLTSRNKSVNRNRTPTGLTNLGITPIDFILGRVGK